MDKKKAQDPWKDELSTHMQPKKGHKRLLLGKAAVPIHAF
jgi:hypothetical protein